QRPRALLVAVLAVDAADPRGSRPPPRDARTRGRVHAYRRSDRGGRARPGPRASQTGGGAAARRPGRRAALLRRLVHRGDRAEPRRVARDGEARLAGRASMALRPALRRPGVIGPRWDELAVRLAEMLASPDPLARVAASGDPDLIALVAWHVSAG